MRKKKIDFEKRINKVTSLKDISLESVENYLEEIGVEKTPIAYLKEKELVKNKNGTLYPTNAGILLFGKQPSKFIKGVSAVISKYEKGEIVFSKKLEGNIISLYEEINKLLRENLKIKGIFNSKGILVKAYLEYPEQVISEIISNALVHRSYGTNKQITIDIFEDRMEVYNPDYMLKGEIDFSKRKIKHPLIVEVLSYIKLVENKGEGVNLVRSVVKSRYTHPVEFIRLTDGVKVVLRNEMKNMKVNEKKFKVNASRILEAIKEHGELGSKEIAMMFAISRVTALKYLKRLVEERYILWTGCTTNDCKGKYIVRR